MPNLQRFSIIYHVMIRRKGALLGIQNIHWGKLSTRDFGAVFRCVCAKQPTVPFPFTRYILR
jgi:hypothetical protein